VYTVHSHNGNKQQSSGKLEKASNISRKFLDKYSQVSSLVVSKLLNDIVIHKSDFATVTAINLQTK